MTYFAFKKIKAKKNGKAGNVSLEISNNALAGNWMNLFFKTKLIEWRLDIKLVEILCRSYFNVMTKLCISIAPEHKKMISAGNKKYQFAQMIFL